MRAHDGLTVLHQPFFAPYIFEKYGADHPFSQGFPPSSSKSFQETKTRLLAMAEQSPLFFKELAHILLKDIQKNPEFFLAPNIKIALLVRDPAKSILSCYRKMPLVTSDVIGHKELWEAFLLLSELTGEPPVVIDSDLLLQQPLAVLKQLGAAWGLPFEQKHLQWESGYAEDWDWKDWYIEVGASTGLGTYRGDILREEDRTPCYLDVLDREDRERLQEIYHFHAPYYQLLLQQAIRPLS